LYDFQLTLQINAGQRMAGVIAGRINADHDGGVGVALVARILAHAVGYHPAGLGSGGHHRAARTHAEAVHTARVLAVVHQLVIGRAQNRVAGIRTEARGINHRLRMLDAETDRERLGFDEDAGLEQHLEGIAGAVADGQHHMPAVQHFA